ncbi:hypothetical protein [Maricaulis salignorans]|uniref:Uncharacterized protein n=1 Tax=Maricaulis salignorans TaxID=144026 RepID=A0A1G9VWU4_9PROT|nr:hypothetical protein [Maricaulis salignorans]SDM76377.1 hypothetical protein SAMN04488568_12123 [Maricaulis salignorans]
MAEFFQTVLMYAREGFAEVNALQGLVIALIATVLMTRWARLLVMVLAAVVANVLVDTLRPVLFDQAAVRLPPLLEPAYWHYLLLLFAGFLVVIGIMFMVKRVMMKG